MPVKNIPHISPRVSMCCRIPPLNIFPFILIGVGQLMLNPEIIFGCATFHMQINQVKMISYFFITYSYALRYFVLLLS